MIVKRGNRWGVRVWSQTEQKMVWAGTFDTKDEARRVEAAATLKPRRSRPVTVKDWVDVWLSDYVRPAAATQVNYRSGSNRVTKDIGFLLLGDIDRPTARRWAAEWPSSVTKVARALFGDAMRDGLIDFNPFTGLRIESPRGRKDIDALTETQIHDLARTAARQYGSDYGPQCAALILTLGFGGMRPGELCSLRWDDLDLERRRLTIRWATGADGKEKRPKNGQPRVIAVLPEVADALKDLKRTDTDRIFYTMRGQPFTKGNLNYWWRPISVAWTTAGNKPLSLYWLRHSCATLLMLRGLSPWQVAHQLGHQDGGRLVMSLYGHPMIEAALEQIDLAGSMRFTADRHATDTRGVA